MNKMKSLFLYIIMFMCFNIVSAIGQENIPIELNLEKCINMANETHPDIIKAEKTIEASEASKTQTVATFYPSLSFTSQYSRTNAGTTSFSGGSSIITSQPSSQTNQTNFTVKQRVFDTFRTWHNYKYAVAQEEKNKYALDETRNNMSLQVAQAYFDVISSNHISDLDEILLQQAQKHLDQANANYDAGISPKSDIFSAEVKVTEAKVNLLEAKNDLRTKKATLKNLIGIGVNSDISLSEDTITEEANQELPDVINTALSERPEIKEANAGLNAQDEKLKLLIMDRYPQLVVDLGANVDLTRDPSKPDQSYNVLATLSFPIFDGFLTKAKVDEAQANKEGLEADKLKVERNISLEVEKAYYNLQTYFAKTTLTDQQAQEADKNLKIAEGRYEVGVGSLQELLDAQVSYSKAMNDFIKSKYDYQVALATYKKAIGVKIP